MEPKASKELNLSAEFMLELQEKGLIGTVEFRDWLANHSPSFAEVRDKDIDNDIVLIAKSRRTDWERQQEAMDQWQEMDPSSRNETNW